MRFAARAFLLIAALFPASAPAQIWPNETGPGGDLFGTSGQQFDRLRQSAPSTAPGFGAELPAQSSFPGRASIPILEWTPPPAPQAQPQRSTRGATPRPARRVAAPAPPSAPATQQTDDRAWERSLAERERELEALRQRLNEDRRRFEAARAPAPAARPAQPN